MIETPSAPLDTPLTLLAGGSPASAVAAEREYSLAVAPPALAYGSPIG